MAQVPQDVAEMVISFERSRGYSLPSFEINQTTAYSSKNPTSNQHYSTNKLHMKEIQQPQYKLEKLKGLQCQGDHLKKDCPIVTSKSKSKHSRLQNNKEKQCNLFKSFSEKNSRTKKKVSMR